MIQPVNEGHEPFDSLINAAGVCVRRSAARPLAFYELFFFFHERLLFCHLRRRELKSVRSARSFHGISDI